MFKFLFCKPESYKQGPVLSMGARDVLLILVGFPSSSHNSCPTSQKLREPFQKKEANLGKDSSTRLTDTTESCPR